MKPNKRTRCESNRRSMIEARRKAAGWRLLVAPNSMSCAEEEAADEREDEVRWVVHPRGVMDTIDFLEAICGKEIADSLRSEPHRSACWAIKRDRLIHETWKSQEVERHQAMMQRLCNDQIALFLAGRKHGSGWQSESATGEIQERGPDGRCQEKRKMKERC